MYYILRLNRFNEIKNELLKKFLTFSRKQYNLPRNINQFYENDNITDPNELCSLLRLQNIFIKILKVDETRNDNILKNFYIDGHDIFDGYIDFLNNRKIICDKINFEIKYTNVYLKNLDLELYLIKSTVLYSFSNNNQIYFNVIMLDFYLKNIGVDNLFDSNVEFRIEKDLVKFDDNDQSFIFYTNTLADYDHTMFIANDINYPTKNIEILVNIQSLVQTSRFSLNSQNFNYLDNILIKVEIVA
jgi:hypothetical protein